MFVSDRLPWDGFAAFDLRHADAQASLLFIGESCLRGGLDAFEHVAARRMPARLGAKAPENEPEARCRA